jgi:hypothetical protein
MHMHKQKNGKPQTSKQGLPHLLATPQTSKHEEQGPQKSKQGQEGTSTLPDLEEQGGKRDEQEHEEQGAPEH